MQEMYEDDAISVSESANGRTIANRQKTNNGRKI
jgi:hypothetical protein